MALEYGFSYGTHDTETSKESDAKFAALSDANKKFYHEALPWILMLVDVGVVSETSIPHILGRLHCIQPDWIAEIKNNMNVSDLKEYFKTFIGFKANIATTTRAEFFKKLTNKFKRIVPELSKKNLKEVDSRWA